MVYFSGIFFEVNMIYANKLLRPVGERDFNAAAYAKRVDILGYLIILRHIGIKIILPIERRMAVYFAAEHHPAHNGQFDGLLIHHRKRARITQAYGADVSIRLAARLKQTGAKHFRVGFQLDMSLKPNSIFKFHIVYYTKIAPIKVNSLFLHK